MKKVIAVIFLLMPLLAKPQVPAADALLDKAVAAMKSDAPLQMDYSYTVYDDDDEVVQHDKGVMMLDAERYALLMNDMKVWSNGLVQWSYVAGINEIYITSSTSDEAQNLSPLCVMEKYRGVHGKKMVVRGDEAIVTLSPGNDDAGDVVLAVDMRTSRLKSMAVHMPGQGRVEVVLDRYIPRCKFGPDAFECPVKDYPGVEIVDMR